MSPCLPAAHHSHSSPSRNAATVALLAVQVEGGQTSTGSAVAWYRRLLGEPDYAALNQEAAAVPPGCEGVVCLDHFQVRCAGLCWVAGAEEVLGASAGTDGLLCSVVN